MDTLEPLLNLLSNPNVAYLILVAGLWAAALAVVVPGTGLLEASAIGFFALSALALLSAEVNWWGAALLGLGAAGFVLALLRRRSALFLPLSALALSAGSAFVFRAEDGSGVNPFLAVGVTAVTVAYFWIAIRKSLEAQRLRPRQDPDSLIGQIAEVRSELNPEGAIYFGGELWTARADEALPAGTRVKIVGRMGLTLKVTRSS